MPINFGSLPEELRIAIVHKQAAFDFAKFSESSRIAKATAEKVNTKITLSAENVVCTQFSSTGFPLRLLLPGYIARYIRADCLIDSNIRIVADAMIIDGSLTKKLAKWLTNCFIVTNSHFHRLYFLNINCNPDQFNGLISASKISGFECSRRIAFRFLRIPAIMRIEYLNVQCLLDDRQFLLMKTPTMILHSTQLTSRGINWFLKQWIKGDRIIKKITITTSETLQKDAIFNGISYSLGTSSNWLHEVYILQNLTDLRIKAAFSDHFFDVNLIS